MCTNCLIYALVYLYLSVVAFSFPLHSFLEMLFLNCQIFWQISSEVIEGSGLPNGSSQTSLNARSYKSSGTNMYCKFHVRFWGLDTIVDHIIVILYCQKNFDIANSNTINHLVWWVCFVNRYWTVYHLTMSSSKDCIKQITSDN